MRAAPPLCLLAALAGCNFPDPDLRPAPPRRAAFGEAVHCWVTGDSPTRPVLKAGIRAWREGQHVPVNWTYAAPEIEEAGKPGRAWELDLGKASDPDLSGDGNSLVLAWQVSGSDHAQIYLLRRTKEWFTQSLVSEASAVARAPSFAPDASRIAWAEVVPSESRIWVTDLETGRHTFITRGDNPSWSPDAQWIAFEDGTPPSLYKVRPDGTERTRLTEHRDARRPTWSPDSQWIAFGQFDADGKPDDIWAVRADGSRYLRVTWDPAPEWDPCWAPDGRILFTTIRNGSQGIWAVAPENTELLK